MGTCDDGYLAKLALWTIDDSSSILYRDLIRKLRRRAKKVQKRFLLRDHNGNASILLNNGNELLYKKPFVFFFNAIVEMMRVDSR